MSTPRALAAATVFPKAGDFAFLGDLRFLGFVFLVAIVCRGFGDRMYRQGLCKSTPNTTNPFKRCLHLRLELSCRIYAMADKWEYYREIGNALARLTPERLFGLGQPVPMPCTSLDARRKPTTRSMPACTGSGMSTKSGTTWPATHARWGT